MTNRIMTLHPDKNKTGVNIELAKYELFVNAIIQALEERDMKFSKLGELLTAQLSNQIDGSVLWYYTTVKLDLEARGKIERIKGKSPQVIRLIEE